RRLHPRPQPARPVRRRRCQAAHAPPLRRDRRRHARLPLRSCLPPPPSSPSGPASRARRLPSPAPPRLRGPRRSCVFGAPGAMLLLPTQESGGRANLHQSGIGTGIDLESGLTHHAVQRNHFVEAHPDTGLPVVGLRVPYWREVLAMSRRVAEAVGLGYVGVDIVVDVERGPMLLEANARPGLAIQIANGRGLVPRLAAIDARLDARPATIRLDEARAAPRPSWHPLWPGLLPVPPGRTAGPRCGPVS